MLLHLLFSMLNVIVFSIPNFDGLVDGPLPVMHNLILSIFYLIIWFFYGLIMGNKRKISYLPFSLLFFLSIILISFFTLSGGPTPLWKLTLMFWAPLNGLRYVVDVSGWKFAIMASVIPLLVTQLAYLLGMIQLGRLLGKR